MAIQKKTPAAKKDNSSRNYLIIIIGLFALVCLFAGFAAASPAIEAAQRWILIVLAIVFAVAGLVLSVWTIVRQTNLSGDSNEFGWKNSPTDHQRRKLEQNLRAIIEDLKTADVQTDDLFSAYIVAEDLAMRQIQQENRENLLRHQNIGGIDFDAILLKPDAVTCVETAFLVTADVPQNRINEILSRITAAKKSFERSGNAVKLKLLYVLVTQLDKKDEAQLRSSLVDKFSATSVNVDIRLFDFEELQRNYAP